MAIAMPHYQVAAERVLECLDPATDCRETQLGVLRRLRIASVAQDEQQDAQVVLLEPHRGFQICKSGHHGRSFRRAVNGSENEE